MNFKDKKVLVCGIAKSGISAACLLKKHGAVVTVADSKKEENLGEQVKILKNANIELYLGKNPDDIISEKDLVILSPGVPTDLSFIKEAEKNGINVISEFELGFNFCKAPVFAITGTNGKTTTTTLVGEIFKNYLGEGYVEVVGNIGIPYSERAEKLDENCAAVAEVSSFQLEKIKNFKPKVSAVLNITPDHLNRHKTVENYTAAKMRIFENQDKDDFLVLNYDDKTCRNMREQAKCKCVFFTRNRSLKECGLDEGVYSDENSIYVKLFGYDCKVIDIDKMNILGGHNVENAMAAVAVALCGKVPLDVIVKTLKEFKGVEHRIEYVKTINDIEFYNDSKGTNPDAAIKAVEAMKRPILLIGGGYDKGSDFTEWIMRFGEKVKFMAIMGEVSDIIAKTADKCGFADYKKVEGLKEAVEECFNRAKKGDCVLLSPACASWDMFKSYEQRGDLFKKYVYDLEEYNI